MSNISYCINVIAENWVPIQKHPNKYYMALPRDTMSFLAFSNLSKSLQPQTSSPPTYLWTNSTEQPTAISWTNNRRTTLVSFRDKYSLDIINTFVYSLKSQMDVMIFHCRSWAISRWRWWRQCWYGRSWCGIQVTMRLMTRWVSSFLTAHQHIWHIAIWEAHPVGGLHVSFSDKYLPEIINTFVICVLSEKSNGWWLRQCWYGRSWCGIQVTMRLMTRWVSSFLTAHQHILGYLVETVLIRAFFMLHSVDYETYEWVDS